MGRHALLPYKPLLKQTLHSLPSICINQLEITLRGLRRLATVSSTFSNSYTLKDKYYHYLTSDATIMVLHKCSIFGKQVAVILFI